MGSVAAINTSNVEQLATNAYRRMDDTLVELQQPLEKEFRPILGTADFVKYT